MKNLIKTKSILILILFFSFCSYAQKNTTIFTQKSVKHFEKTLAKINDNFYMSSVEVSNGLYNEFLGDLRQNGDMEKYAVAIYDSTKWRVNGNHNHPFVNYYHRYPAYRDYPEVNISYEGAVLFCEWLTSKYNSLEKRAFKKVVFRLPTGEEWKHAARGDIEKSIYPWGGPYSRNAKGYMLCNYNGSGDENIYFDTVKKEYVVIKEGDKDSNRVSFFGNTGCYTVSVFHFPPNDYGIYNISGNVAEMTAEKGIARGGSYISPGYDVRIDSEEKYTEPAAHIGFRFCMEIIEK